MATTKKKAPAKKAVARGKAAPKKDPAAALKERAEKQQKVLDAMESGTALRKACEAIGLPDSTFLLWVKQDPGLAERYAHAREVLLDRKAEELEEIGEAAASSDSAVQVAGLRLQSDNRKWLLAKLRPQKYGEKIGIGGAEGLPPIRTDLSDAERAVRLAALLGGTKAS